MRWENALNENWKRIIVHIEDENYKVMSKQCRFRELKFLDLEIEIRRTESVTAFLDMLQFFDKMRDKDIVEVNKKYQDDEGFDVSKYIPKYYIHIMKLNVVPLKRSETVISLVEKLTNILEVPVKFSPNNIVVEFDGANSDNSDDYFNSIHIPRELENKMKYNQKFDILHFKLRGKEFSLQAFLENEHYEAKRLKIETSHDLDCDAVDWIINNKNNTENVEYLHLMISQNSINFISAFISKSAPISSLIEFSINFDYKELAELLSLFFNIKEINEYSSISKISKTNCVEPELNCLINRW